MSNSAMLHELTGCVFAGDGVDLVVEARFRSHFDIPRGGPSYQQALAALPDLLVVELQHMPRLVAAIARCMANEYLHMVREPSTNR